MKVIRINNKDYVLKFTSKVISELHIKDITITSLSQDLGEMKTNNLYTAFYHGLKAMQKDITIDEAYKIIDDYFEEDEERTLEDFFLLVLEEYCKAMGLLLIFKEMKKENEKKKLSEQEKKVMEIEKTEI